MKKYLTIQGDTFDIIAKRVYGDEKYLRYLIPENEDYADTMIFSGGVELNIPDLPPEAMVDNGQKAPWR